MLAYNLKENYITFSRGSVAFGSTCLNKCVSSVKVNYYFT